MGVYMFAGDTVVMNVTATESDGTAMNLASLNILWALAKSNVSAAVLTKTMSNGISVIDATAGKFRVTLSKEDTKALSGVYYHEMRIVDGSVSSIIYTGTLSFTPTITKA